MKIISEIGEVKKSFQHGVLAIGVFDGLHRGHQELIRRTIREAKRIHGRSLVMTFYPHPVHVLHPEIPLPLIVSLPFRLKLLEDLGVDVCFLVKFTRRFSRLTPEKFIKRYLVGGLHPKEIFVGDDFRFGQNRTGTLEYFQEVGRKFGFKVNIVRSIKGGLKTISSTHIRELISSGQLTPARKLLARPVAIMGVVQKGDARGRVLGFPTANIYPTNEVIPPLGVYAVHVMIGRRTWHGMANVGRRPSFKTHDNRVNVEVHIFNFKKNLYGQEIIIEFIKKIRDEKVFLNKDQFVDQLRHDQNVVQAIFRRKMQ